MAHEEPIGIALPTPTDLLDNYSVSYPLAALPETFAEAEQRFKTFLVTNRYPAAIWWISPRDLVVTGPREYSIRKRTGSAAMYADEKFGHGLANGIGVEIRAICASDSEAFATVYVPKNDIDAESHLMGNGLKLSCPVERPAVTIVTNSLKWLFLSRRDAGRSSVLFE
jgi:hypothetical protein